MTQIANRVSSPEIAARGPHQCLGAAGPSAARHTCPKHPVKSPSAVTIKRAPVPEGSRWWQASCVHSVEQALAALGRAGPDLAEDARAAWESLTGGDGPEAVTQWRLQRFCWDELNRTWIVDAPHRWRVAQALAALLDALGMQRYAEIARGETTGQILLTGDPAPDRGRTVVRRAMQRSGIEPPDTELLTWGAVMGPREAEAQEMVADRLELSVAAGELLPGSRGWRDQQAEVTID